MKHLHIKTAYQLIAILLPLFFALFSSCTPISVGNITPTATPPTPSVTPSPTKRTCPPSSSIITPEKVTIPQHLVIVLYDPYESSGVMEFQDERSTSNVLEFVRSVFQKAAQPGDRYAIFRLGCRDYSCARVMNENSSPLESPLIAATPSPQTTLTPVSTPTYQGQTIFEKSEIGRSQTATVTAQYATATEMAFQDDCARLDWIQNYATEYAAWESTKAAAQATFLTQIASNLDAYQNNLTSTATPYAPNALYEGLRDVTVIFQNECGKYQRCILLIFDDLEEWRIGPEGKPAKPPNFYINLSNVDIVTVVLKCVDVYQPDCTTKKKIWEPELKSYGALKVELYNGKDLEKNLIQYLRR